MKSEDAKHYLSVLIESKLFPILKVLEEGSFSQEQLDYEQQKAIINFLNHLPENYRISNLHEVIIETLEKMGMVTLWGQKKKEEMRLQEKTKKLENTVQTIKDNRQEER